MSSTKLFRRISSNFIFEKKTARMHRQELKCISSIFFAIVAVLFWEWLGDLVIWWFSDLEDTINRLGHRIMPHSRYTFIFYTYCLSTIFFLSAISILEIPVMICSSSSSWDLVIYPSISAISTWHMTSISEPVAISRKWMRSFSEKRPMPSAILDGIETAARWSWLVSPNCSWLRKPFVP